MRPVARAGRWAWGLCGLATAAALVVPGTRLIVSAGVRQTPARTFTAHPPRQLTARILTRTMTVLQPVTSLNVQGYGPGLIQVKTAPVTHVQISEMIIWSASRPAVTQSVSGGRLSLADPACANDSCSVSFVVTVPRGVTVTAVGGPLFISGTSGANLKSEGAPVSVTDIHGPLDVSTQGGPLQINGLSGPLRADTGGGQVVASHVTGATAVVTSSGGPVQIAFSAAPTSVKVSTGGGLAELSVPGGPYALTTNSDGAAQTIGIATSSAAHRSITITTGGGPLIIGSGRIRGFFYGPPPPSASAIRNQRSVTTPFGGQGHSLFYGPRPVR
jgi:hypothetical protein